MTFLSITLAVVAVAVAVAVALSSAFLLRRRQKRKKWIERTDSCQLYGDDRARIDVCRYASTTSPLDDDFVRVRVSIPAGRTRS